MKVHLYRGNIAHALATMDLFLNKNLQWKIRIQFWIFFTWNEWNSEAFVTKTVENLFRIFVILNFVFSIDQGQMHCTNKNCSNCNPTFPFNLCRLSSMTSQNLHPFVVKKVPKCFASILKISIVIFDTSHIRLQLWYYFTNNA